MPSKPQFYLKLNGSAFVSAFGEKGNRSHRFVPDEGEPGVRHQGKSTHLGYVHILRTSLLKKHHDSEDTLFLILSGIQEIG